MTEHKPIPVLVQTSTRKLSIRWGAFLILIGLVALAAIGQGSGFSFLIYGFAGLFLLSWVWLNRSMRGLFIRRQMDDHAYFGQEISVRIDLNNRGVWPILWLHVDEKLPIELSSPNFMRAVVSLTPREQVQFAYQLSCWKRGYYDVGPLDLQSGDFWGIFEGGKYQMPAQKLIVYPRMIQLSHISLPSQTPEGVLSGHERLIEDPSRAYGVRPYIAGDSLRKVDWKSTAASNQLQVKRYQSSIAYDAHLFLNLNQSDYQTQSMFSATEMGITIASSLAAYLSEQRQAVGLTAFGSDPLGGRAGICVVPLGKGSAHLMQILELLARVQKTVIEESFVEILPRASAGLPWGTLTFMITPRIEERLYGVLLGIRRRGLQPVVVLTQSGAEYRMAKAKLKQVGVPCFRIEREGDFDIWRGGRAPFVKPRAG